MKGKTINMLEGRPVQTVLLFSVPLIFGNIAQQLYYITDAVIVGKFIGIEALAAVNSCTWVTWLLNAIARDLSNTLCILASYSVGEKDQQRLKKIVGNACTLTIGISILLTVLAEANLELFFRLFKVQEEIIGMTRDYFSIALLGIPFVLIYNVAAALLRADGNSKITFYAVASATVINIVLDLLFIAGFGWGVAGGALATVIAQFVSGIGLLVYALLRCPQLRLSRRHLRVTAAGLREIANLSFLTCLQQSVMNFGILAVQGLVNSFGPAVMAAFAAAVKIDSFAYMPVQDFGNAFSTFIAQNYGAGKEERIRRGARSAVLVSFVFCIVVSAVVFILAEPLLHIFIDPAETAITAIGVQYLRIEGAFYCGIGCLFLLYGYFRAVRRPGVSLVLTIVSLGTRVVLAFALSAVPWIGVVGIWASVPIGWFLADALGLVLYRRAPLERELANES